MRGSQPGRPTAPSSPGSRRMARRSTSCRWFVSAPARNGVFVVRPFRAARVAVLAALLTSAATFAQAPQQPTFRTGVQLIEVDVRVFDKDGRFVTDLTRDDFEPAVFVEDADVNLDELNAGA